MLLFEELLKLFYYLEDYEATRVEQETLMLLLCEEELFENLIVEKVFGIFNTKRIKLLAHFFY